MVWSHRWFRINLSERHPFLFRFSWEISGLGSRSLYRTVEIEKRSKLDISTGGTAIISVPQRYPAEVVLHLFRRSRSSNPVCIGENRLYPLLSIIPPLILFRSSESFLNLLSIYRDYYCPRFRFYCERELNRNGQYIYSIYLSFHTAIIDLTTFFQARGFINYINPNWRSFFYPSLTTMDGIKFR